MGHDPAEKAVPKSQSAPKTSRPSELKDNIRRQGPVSGQDEVHFHDNAQNIVFVWNGGRSFRIAWQEFLGMRGQMEAGDVLAFIGDTSNPSNGRKAGVWVWEKLADGSMEHRVEEFDKDVVYDFEIRYSDKVEDMDDWIEKKC